MDTLTAEYFITPADGKPLEPIGYYTETCPHIITCGMKQPFYGERQKYLEMVRETVRQILVQSPFGENEYHWINPCRSWLFSTAS